MREWKSIKLCREKHLGIVEIENNGCFEIVEGKNFVLFGGHSNSGFIPSGYIKKQKNETLDETLNEMILDLETFYRDGKKYCNRIVCNERM